MTATPSKVRMGMVGGGQGAFIGAVHRMAAQIDAEIELVCGAFSSDPKRSIESGRALFLDTQRCYASYQQMFAAEAALPAEQRMEFVAIVTPNHLHYDVARHALEAGFHVLSDKPATLNLAEALSLQEIITSSGCHYGLTHTYTGYPMIKQAKHLVASGELGQVIKVVAEYSQGWLAAGSNDTNKQASWRLDPAQSGESCCMGDIGVHAANLAEFVSGLQMTEICADLCSVVPGRTLDDDGTVLMRFDNGAHGVLMASQISVGEENNLRLRIYGDKASLDWCQQEPNTLWLKFNHQPAQMLRTGVGQMADAAVQATRIPAGHPEGYLEAFANIYLQFSRQIRGQAQQVPGIEDAVRGMAFIHNVVRASRADAKWHPFSLTPDTKLQDQIA